jgi:hypothetical protein
MSFSPSRNNNKRRIKKYEKNRTEFEQRQQTIIIVWHGSQQPRPSGRKA